MNSYGVRLLMPFSDRWFYGDALYIVDPWLYLAARRRLVVASARRGIGRGRRPARIGAGAGGGLRRWRCSASNVWARAEVRDGLARAGPPADTRFMVTPVVVNPFRREVVDRPRRRYEKGISGSSRRRISARRATASTTGFDRPEAQRPLQTPLRARRSCAGRAFRSSSSIRRRRPRRLAQRLSLLPTSGPMAGLVVVVEAAVNDRATMSACACRRAAGRRCCRPAVVGCRRWGFEAHKLIADRMIALLPAELKPLFEKRRAFIVERSIDPDLWRNVGWEDEPPNHFLDIDSRGVRPVSVRRRCRATTTRRCRSSARTFVHAQGLLPWRRRSSTAGCSASSSR